MQCKYSFGQTAAQYAGTGPTYISSFFECWVATGGVLLTAGSGDRPPRRQDAGELLQVANERQSEGRDASQSPWCRRPTHTVSTLHVGGVCKNLL